MNKKQLSGYNQQQQHPETQKKMCLLCLYVRYIHYVFIKFFINITTSNYKLIFILFFCFWLAAWLYSIVHFEYGY